MKPSTVEDRLRQLEKRTQYQENMIRKIGDIMGEEFDFDDLLNDVDAEMTAEEVAKPEVETQEEIDKLESEFDDLFDEPEAEDLVTEVTEEIAPTPEPVPVQNVTVATDPGIEFAEETKAYIRAKSDIELRRKALATEQKELKEEFKDAGVDIKTADAAAKEIARRLKQSADEADMIEKTMKMFEADDGIYTTLAALND